MSQPFCSRDRGSKTFLLPFLNHRAISPGPVQVKQIWCLERTDSLYIYIYI